MHCDLHEYAEYKDAEDMIQQLNVILSKPVGFHQSRLQGKIATS